MPWGPRRQARRVTAQLCPLFLTIPPDGFDPLDRVISSRREGRAQKCAVFAFVYHVSSRVDDSDSINPCASRRPKKRKVAKRDGAKRSAKGICAGNCHRSAETPSRRIREFIGRPGSCLRTLAAGFLVMALIYCSDKFQSIFEPAARTSSWRLAATGQSSLAGLTTLSTQTGKPTTSAPKRGKPTVPPSRL